MSRDVVILACSISAGIHGALTPAHFRDGLGPGLGFAAATVLLAAAATAITVRPASELAVAVAAVVLSGLLGSYALATTAGVPFVHPDPEPVDALGLVTKAIEVAGLLAAGNVLGSKAGDESRPIPLALPALIATFSALAALAFSAGHGAHA